MSANSIDSIYNMYSDEHDSPPNALLSPRMSIAGSYAYSDLFETAMNTSSSSNTTPALAESKEFPDVIQQHLPPLPLSRQTTPSSSYLAPQKTVQTHVSPSSKISLVPSEGEDMDGFHVRNTYAQLEVSGVKGDGYEEGIERTRARVGTSRLSQMQADAALGDGSDKKRELDMKEIQVLKTVDR